MWRFSKLWYFIKMIHDEGNQANPVICNLNESWWMTRILWLMITGRVNSQGFKGSPSLRWLASLSSYPQEGLEDRRGPRIEIWRFTPKGFFCLIYWFRIKQSSPCCRNLYWAMVCGSCVMTNKHKPVKSHDFQRERATSKACSCISSHPEMWRSTTKHFFLLCLLMPNESRQS